MRAKAWMIWRAMNGLTVELSKPSKKDCIDSEALYSESDVKILINAAKKVIDISSDKCEFNTTQSEEAYFNLRKLCKHLTEESFKRKASRNIMDSIDEQVMKSLRG